MSEFISVIEGWLLGFSEAVSVELFVMVGGFLEELIAPIPSPLVLGTAGTLAEVSGSGLWYLVWIAVVASAAKLVASLILYFVVDKFEDVFMGRFGRFFGVSHEDIERIGAKLGESFWRSFGVLFIFRSLPVVSSAVVSVVSGFLKVDLKSYVVATFLGNIIRNLFFIMVGYYGLEATSGVMGGLEAGESVFKLLVVLGGVGWFVWWKLLRKK